MNALIFEDIIEDFDPEDYLDYKDELLNLVKKYNAAMDISERDRIGDQLQERLKDIKEGSPEYDLNGNTTLRYEFGKIGGGKYRD